jgi:hypothetical protein
MSTRPYREPDRGEALAVLGDARAIDSPRAHVHVSDGGAASGLALWLEPSPGELAYLGPISVPTGTPRRTFYELAAACARDALARGYARGSFHVHDDALLDRLRRDFAVTPEPVGWAPITGEPVHWEITVDLADAVQQLARTLARLP